MDLGVLSNSNAIVPILRLFLVVCLDIKDLQFIREVLKDKSFNNTKWFDLGMSLELLEPDLKAISKASNDASDCLRECLALWLKSGKATPHLLVHSLKSVDEAPAAQYARKICKHNNIY